MAIMCSLVNALSMFSERLKMIERFGKCIFQRMKTEDLVTLNDYNDHNL